MGCLLQPAPSRSALGTAACLALALVPATAWAVQKPRPEDRVLPNFDSRVGGPRALARRPGIGRALERLSQRGALTLQARFHPLTGAVRVLSSRDGALAAAGTGSPETIARGFLGDNAEVFGLAETDVESLVKTHEYATGGGALRHVVFAQAFEGIGVFGSVLGVHLDRSGAVVRVTNSAIPRGTGDAGQYEIGPEQAVRAAAANVRPEVAFEPRAVGTPSGRARAGRFARGPFRSDIPAELVYFPTHAGARLAWRVVVEPAGFPQSYEVLVDAHTGEILFRRNRVLYADGAGAVVQSDTTAAQDARRPDEHPAGFDPSGADDPATGCPPVSGYGPRSLTVPFRDPQTVLSGTGRLSGNDTRAFHGTPGTWGAAGTNLDGTWHFDFPFGSAGSAETHLFFASNFAHDFFYDLGFDEAAGNFQAANFGRGGLGGDPLHAVARANGRNNATFEPAPEGQSPIMSMFLFDGSGCWSADVDGDGLEDVDGDYDADIVMHEFHHGVSHRLNTAFTGAEADAIGEGGSDFFAYSIYGNTKLAESVMPPDGIRQVNDKTYADWFCFFFFFYCEPHDNGEIFANVMWDLRERFRTDEVEGSEAAAIHEAHRLYVDALKLSPPSPTMLDMRDALLQADLLRNPSGDPGGSESYCRIWTAFAGRGMGRLALDTEDTGDNTVVADFTVPSPCPAPPPKPTVTVVATDAAAAEAGSDTATFTFSRTGETTDALTVSYSIDGTATPGHDYVVLSGTVRFPAGSAEARVVLAPLDDPLVEPDETVTVVVDARSGYVVGAPGIATATIVSEDVAPDLVITALAAPPATGAGLTITITDTTKNRGTEVAAASLTRFHLSRDGVLDAADILLGERAVPAIAIGASSAGSTTLTVPASTPAGAWYLIGQADAGHALAEIEEGNNLAITYIHTGPDLVMAGLSVPAVGGAGLPITITDTTRNQGGGSAPPSATRFYLSANAVVDAGDAVLGSRAVPALAPGANSAGSTTATIPAGTLPGGYYVLAQADGDASVAEVNDGNNTTWGFLYIGPDLVISGVAAPTTTGAGATFVLTETTRNQGGGTAATSTTRFYLSANAAIDATDTVLGSRSVPALVPAAASAASTSLTIPAGTGSGAYYVLIQADAAAVVTETQEFNNISYAYLQIGPDLVVSPLTAPATAGAGSTITLGDTTRNQGAGPAAASVTRFHLSTNGAVDGSDVLLGSRAVPALGAGATSAASTALTIPSGTAPGLYYVLAQADADGAVNETQEANNVALAAVTVGADLVVSALSAPPVAGPGTPFTVTDTTRNQGGGPAGESSTRFFLSANAVIEDADILLGMRAVPALGPGASSPGSTSLTIPVGTASGAYYLLVQADGASVVAETQETNNVFYGYIRVGPDLVVSSFVAPATTGAGTPFTVTETTRNQGGGVAGESQTWFLLSSNAVADAADTLLGSRAVPALGAGTSSAASTSLALPAGTAPGGYYLLAQSDGAGVVGETQEGNNLLYAYIYVGPDLVVSAVTIPAAASAGATLTIGETTRNQGAGAAAASTTRLYLSANGWIDASDVLLGSRAVGPLAPVTSSAGSTVVTIPPATTSGLYYVLVQADGDGVVSETQETNNTAAGAVWIGADLVISALSAPAMGGAGAAVTVTETTRNQGGGAAGASTTRYYLSANALVDPGDVPLGSRAVPSLTGGASSTAVTSLLIPATTPTAAYYLLAQADGGGEVAETQETNNTAYAYIQVGPDLIVSAFTAPTSGGIGSTLTVTDTTTNQAASTAAASTTKFYLSANAVVDATDTLLATRAIGDLAGGASSSASTVLAIPATTSPGGYYVFAQADGEGAVLETQEGNNTRYVYLLIGPDLNVPTISVPPTAGAGATITVGETTRNAGGGTAAPSTTKVFLSANPYLDAADTLLGARSVGALASGESSPGSTLVTIPATTAPGIVYLIVQADGDGIVAEVQEANNTLWASLQVGPDLVMWALSLSVPAARAGATVTVNDTTRNQGGGTAVASVTRFYFSTNASLDAADVPLGSRGVDPLAAAGTSAGSTAVTIPPGTGPGYYYVLAQADSANAVAESQETNNTWYAYIRIDP